MPRRVAPSRRGNDFRNPVWGRDHKFHICLRRGVGVRKWIKILIVAAVILALLFVLGSWAIINSCVQLLCYAHQCGPYKSSAEWVCWEGYKSNILGLRSAWIPQ